MPKKKSKFPDPPAMKSEMKMKFRQFIKKEKKQPASWRNPTWQLWRWDNLEDASQTI